MLIAFIITMSALMFGVRIIVRAHRENIISDHALTKIGTAYFCALIVINHFSSSTISVVWFASFAPLIALILFFEVARLTRRRAVYKVFSESLNHTLLKMKSGKSFRQSFTEVINDMHSSHAQRMREIFDIVVFTQQDKDVFQSQFLTLIVRELRFADQNPHSAITRLQTLRMRIKIEENFRRKSGHALKQVRAQSILMSGLFLAVVCFVVSNFGFTRHQHLILIATTLFACGLFWIYSGGKKLRWKV